MSKPKYENLGKTEDLEQNNYRTGLPADQLGNCPEPTGRLKSSLRRLAFAVSVAGLLNLPTGRLTKSLRRPTFALTVAGRLNLPTGRLNLPTGWLWKFSEATELALH
ncbi:unnamed protein product [Rhodiola kirilowii]